MISADSGQSKSSSAVASVPGLRLAKAGLWMTLAPVLIDYRTPEGTVWAVPLYTTILLISVTGTGMLLQRFGLAAWSRYRGLLAVATFYCLLSIAMGFFWKNTAEVVLRTAPPLILYASGMFSIGALMASRIDPRLLWPTVLKAAFIGMAVQVVLVQAVVGIDLSTIRFQILTGGGPLVSAFVVTAVFFGGWNLWRAMMSVTHLALVMISVTRTHLVVLIAAFAFFLAAARERALQVSRLGVLFVSMATLCLVVVTVDALLPVSPISRWVGRFTVVGESHYGYDVTELTRIGEARQQIALLKESPIGMLLGYGAASPTGMDEESKTLLRVLVGNETAEYVGQGIGHNTYVGIFFVGGLLGGGLLLLTQLWIFTRAFLLTTLLSSRQYRAQSLVILCAPVSYFAYMVFGSLAATLGARSTAMLFAMATGFTLWAYGLLQNDIRAQIRETRLRRLRRSRIAG